MDDILTAFEADNELEWFNTYSEFENFFNNVNDSVPTSSPNDREICDFIYLSNFVYKGSIQ